jgi:NHLM bacteriocin system ABC transporter ATP-binding protein
METTIPAPGATFVLRIVASSDSRRVGQQVGFGGPGTIGRDPACTIALDDQSVSRCHARVERAEGGVRVVDLQSGDGVWIGSVRLAESLIPPGGRFRIGSTVFELLDSDLERAAPRGFRASASTASRAPHARPDPAIESFTLRVLQGGTRVPAGTEFAVPGRVAVLGRSIDCTVALPEADVSRRHLRVEVSPDGFRLRDLGSTGGTWIGPRQIVEAVVGPGEPFRLSNRLVLVCELENARPPAREIAATDPTLVLRVDDLERQSPAPPDVGPDQGETTLEGATPSLVSREAIHFANLGEAVDPSPQQPFSLDDPDQIYYVVSGGLLVFTVAGDVDGTGGTRTYLLDVPPGSAAFGLDLVQYGTGTRFLASARPQTRLRRVPRDRVQALGAKLDTAPIVAALVDDWVTALTRALGHGAPARREEERQLQPGEQVQLPPHTKASSAAGVLWVDVWSGSLLVDDIVVPTFAERRALFPVTPDSWIEPVSDEFGALALNPLATSDAIGTPALWRGLEIFHASLCEGELLNRQLARADEFVRLQEKARHAEAAREVAYDAIGSVLRPEPEIPREFLAASAAEPVLRAMQLVGRALGVAIKSPPDASEDLSFEERVVFLASASGVRTRGVALRDDWYRRDHGPLLGQLAESKAPVALLPTSPSSYECLDPARGTRTPVDAKVASTLTSFAHTFYRPLPEGRLSAWDLIRFGARGLRLDLRLLSLTAVVVGLFGTVTPYLTGRIIDSAIPQADYAALYGFGLALAASAIATALFKLVQGIASVRAQARMEYAIQSGLWDRLLTLPPNFFRRYSAGDLADRVAGVDAIQTLVSGAGIGAVLGSISGLFFVVQMFAYNLRLGLLAVVLTAIYVAFNFVANYLQLRYQRVEIQLRGRIAGLVLNLITGVSKLRVSGAEHHAFRVWAQQFAAQRRLSFKAGLIKSVALTFGAVFPLLSSIAIFLVMLGQQQSGDERLPLTTGEFIAFNAAFGLFLAAMQALGDASLNLLRVVPIYERFEPILVTPPEVDRGKLAPGRLKGEIELSHVSFRYGEDGPWILRNMSLKIRPGEFVAFVGPSGCGKSTLLRLLLGFERPTSGTVYYDGQDLGALDLRLVRQQMGVVLQVSRVMPSEIYRNIVGTSRRTIDDAWRAAEMAGLADDIRNMPMGMHTYVSEGGGTLSGGQRQRLLIARAVVNRPKLLFLDEATSALDNRTQAIVAESFERLEATRVVIAHRLSTIANADRICYLDAGEIAETGTYQELMARDGLFARLARRQMS